MDRYIINGPESCQPISELSVGKQIFDNLKLCDPNKPLLIDAFTGKSTTAREFHKNSCRVAHCLSNGYGLNLYDVVTIGCENNLYYLEIVAAALYAGICLAPVNHNYSDVEIRHVLNIAKPKLIFTSKTHYQKYLRLKSSLTFIEKIIVFDYNDTNSSNDDVIDFNDFLNKYSTISDIDKYEPAVLDTYNHLAVILGSSGTTGLPKGVMTTHRNINVRLMHVSDKNLNDYKPDSIFLSWMPYFHGFGFITNIGYLVNCYTIIVMDRFVDRIFLECIEKYKITHLYVVPPIILHLARSPLLDIYDLSSVREIGCGAAPLSKEVEDQLKRRLKSIRIFQAYGLTECTLAVVYPSVNEPIRSGSSGKVVSLISMRIRDPDTGKSLGPNQAGEVCFKGPLVVPGYYKNYTATKEMFDEEGWLLTGDIAYYDDDGYVYIVDRLKELIKCNAFQVTPAELEALLLKHPQIKDAAVIGIPHPEAGEVPFAYIVKQPNTTLKEEDVVKFIADQVIKYKQLRGGVRFIDEIPKNPSGKILRRVLRQRAANEGKSKL